MQTVSDLADTLGMEYVGGLFTSRLDHRNARATSRQTSRALSTGTPQKKGRISGPFFVVINHGAQAPRWQIPLGSQSPEAAMAQK
jgi:hypothetical protein